MKVKRIEDCDLPTPCRETAGSAGYDLRSNDDYTIYAGERKMVNTGFAWEIPNDMVGLIKPRSGLAYREGLHVMGGVIDSDYRGEVKAILVNLGDKPVHLRQGDRVAQMVVTYFHSFDLCEVDELKDTTRIGGFGSTGVK